MADYPNFIAGRAKQWASARADGSVKGWAWVERLGDAAWLGRAVDSRGGVHVTKCYQQRGVAINALDKALSTRTGL